MVEKKNLYLPDGLRLELEDFFSRVDTGNRTSLEKKDRILKREDNRLKKEFKEVKKTANVTNEEIERLRQARIQIRQEMVAVKESLEQCGVQKIIVPGMCFVSVRQGQGFPTGQIIESFSPVPDSSCQTQLQCVVDDTGHRFEVGGYSIESLAFANNIDLLARAGCVFSTLGGTFNVDVSGTTGPQRKAQLDRIIEHWKNLEQAKRDQILQGGLANLEIGENTTSRVPLFESLLREIRSCPTIKQLVQNKAKKAGVSTAEDVAFLENHFHYKVARNCYPNELAKKALQHAANNGLAVPTIEGHLVTMSKEIDRQISKEKFELKHGDSRLPTLRFSEMLDTLDSQKEWQLTVVDFEATLKSPRWKAVRDYVTHRRSLAILLSGTGQLANRFRPKARSRKLASNLIVSIDDWIDSDISAKEIISRSDDLALTKNNALPDIPGLLHWDSTTVELLFNYDIRVGLLEKIDSNIDSLVSAIKQTKRFLFDEFSSEPNEWAAWHKKLNKTLEKTAIFYFEKERYARKHRRHIEDPSRRLEESDVSHLLRQIDLKLELRVLPDKTSISLSVNEKEALDRMPIDEFVYQTRNLSLPDYGVVQDAEIGKRLLVQESGGRSIAHDLHSQEKLLDKHALKIYEATKNE